jgi:hypothetical protein
MTEEDSRMKPRVNETGVPTAADKGQEGQRPRLGRRQSRTVEPDREVGRARRVIAGTCPAAKAGRTIAFSDN